MTAMLVVETEDFVDSANLVFHSVGAPLQAAVFGLSDALNGCGGMAGDDPAGRAWAQSYDPAAVAALAAGRDSVNACYNLAELFELSAANYEAADQASSPGARAAIAAQTARLPGDASISSSSWRIASRSRSAAMRAERSRASATCAAASFLVAFWLSSAVLRTVSSRLCSASRSGGYTKREMTNSMTRKMISSTKNVPLGNRMLLLAARSVVCMMLPRYLANENSRMAANATLMK